MDASFDRLLGLGSADSLVVLGETAAPRRGDDRPAWLVCVIHRGHGEFTHLYRVPAIATGRRREIGLIGVWTGAALREASARAAAMLAGSDPARKTDQAGSALAKAA